jgi:hypothetical protein
MAIAGGLALLLGDSTAPAVEAAALGTAVTYQGRLLDAGETATGTYDFELKLFDALSGGTQVGPTIDVADVVVDGGIFTLSLDFGAQFNGQLRYLDVGVRPGASTGAYTVLAPRAALSAAPNAQFASSATSAGSAPWSGITGKPAGFNDGIDNDTLASLACASGQVAQWNGSTWACATSGGPPSGAAGGGLTGTYPNPSVAANAVGTSQIGNGTVTVGKLSASGSSPGQVLVSNGATVSWGTPLRSYYLTTGTFDGAHALTACAVGYHVASFFEIRETTLLRYNTTLGLTCADCGSGPPATDVGWYRTSWYSQAPQLTRGENNCLAWTSNLSTNYGTAIGLYNNYQGFDQVYEFQVHLGTWNAVEVSCDTPMRVWCVEN